WPREKMLESELFWNASVVFEKVPMRISTGISRYSTQKESPQYTRTIRIQKFCRYCRKHTTHHEIKK
ncbi:hypothetical protein CFC21_046097, partial [Triticum aestivum]